MIVNYLTLAFRNLIRNKAHSAITILGLVAGVIACIFIYQYAAFELSYDKFYLDHDRVFRISYQKFLDGKETERIAKSPAALASALTASVPEVEHVTRLGAIDNLTITTDQAVSFNAAKAFITDTSFQYVLAPVLLKGSLADEGIVISESLAKKYFKNDPLNKSVTGFWEEKFDAKVVGVFQDLPTNTHLHYDVLLITNSSEGDDSWQWTGFYTYVKLKAAVSVEAFEQKMNKLANENVKSEFNVSTRLSPQRLTDIHLHSDLQEETEPNGSYEALMFLIIVGCFILTIAWVNYLNLSIARLSERLKEIGIRKVIGSGKTDLMKQFVVESLLFNVISLSLALLLARLLSPAFQMLSGKQLIFDDLFSDGYFTLGMISVMIIGVTVSGVYPAVVYSRFKPVTALKGTLNTSSERLSLRSVLMGFQFAIASFLITGTLVVYQQMDFMSQSDLGINIDHIVVVKSPNLQKETWSDQLTTYVIDSTYYTNTRSFANSLSGHALQMTSISHVPGKELIWGTEGFRREDATANDVHALCMAGIDYAFLPTFGMKLLAGRNFSEHHRTDQLNAVIINEEASKVLGFENPESAIGTNLVFFDSKKEIIGVVRNYHQESLKRAIKPTFYQLLPRALDYFAIKIPTEDVPESIARIKQSWAATFGDSPFEYFFLDDFFNTQYKEDQRFGRVFSTFTALSIFIACIGLFGLSSRTILQRTKEIGIRKILGATVLNVLQLLSGYYFKVIGIAFVFAVPLSFFAAEKWLNTFAFRMNLSWWIFLLPLGALVTTTIVTISFQALRTSLANPINSLRLE